MRPPFPRIGRMGVVDPFASYLSHNSFRQDEASGSGVGEEYYFRCFLKTGFSKRYIFSGFLVRHFVLALSIFFFAFVRVYVKTKNVYFRKLASSLLPV